MCTIRAASSFLWRAKQGSILILVLWTVSLLAAFAVILGYQVRQQLTLAWRLEERERLGMLAAAGARRALVVVKTDDSEQSAGWLGSPLSLNEEDFADQELSGGLYSIGYEYWDEHTQSYAFWYGLMDEERKINLNTAELGVLQRLISEVLAVDETEALEYASAIVDWRDEDTPAAPSSAGAEDSYYQGLPRAYEAKDAPFEVLEELLLVKGITPDIYAALKAYVTIYSQGPVNINTAAKPVLIALGLNEELAADILEYRTGDDGASGTSDDHIFDAPSAVVEQLNQAYALSAEDIHQLNQVLGSMLGCYSNTFSFSCRARSRSARSGAAVSCVINREGQILYWRQS